MKKILILCSLFVGFGMTGLLAEDATVSLPTPAPSPAAAEPAAAAAPAQAAAPAAKKHHHHKKHHKKEATEAPAPKS